MTDKDIKQVLDLISWRLKEAREWMADAEDSVKKQEEYLASVRSRADNLREQVASYERAHVALTASWKESGG